MGKTPCKSRREFLKLMAAGAASMPLFTGIEGGSFLHNDVKASGTRKPNVIMIVLDDLNSWVGCMGKNPDVKTPNIDRLAKRGVLFTNAHAASPVCNPSRVSFLTGVRPSTSGIYNNRQQLRSVMPNITTMPQHFMANGYHTIGSGKIFHHHDPDSWNEYIPTDYMGENPNPPVMPMNGLAQTGLFDWGPMDVHDEDMADAKTAILAARILGKDYGKPFFLAAGFVMPHVPLYAPRKYFDMYPLDRITLPKINELDLDDVPHSGKVLAKKDLHANIVAAGQWEKAVQGYLAAVSFADSQVGLILDALDEGPHAGNTIIVLLGDNGWHLGEKLHWQKATLWEESTRCPLIIASPDVPTRGDVCEKAVSMMDVYPTLIDLCGLSPKSEIEANSLAGLLSNPKSGESRPPAITTLYGNNHAVRTDRFRYIRYSDGTEELYDHINDDPEWENLASRPDYASVKEELARWLPTFVAPGFGDNDQD